MLKDLITRQTIHYAIPLSFSNIPQGIVASDPYNDEKHFSTPKPESGATPTVFEPTESKFAIVPNTFAAQDAQEYSNTEHNTLWKRKLFTKKFIKTLKIIKTDLTYDFLALCDQFPDHPNLRNSSIRYNTSNLVRISLQHRILNVSPLWT